MNDDIVNELLYAFSHDTDPWDKTLTQRAADKIEKLYAENSELRSELLLKAHRIMELAAINKPCCVERSCGNKDGWRIINHLRYEVEWLRSENRNLCLELLTAQAEKSACD